MHVPTEYEYCLKMARPTFFDHVRAGGGDMATAQDL
jgi:hypothetical protein